MYICSVCLFSVMCHVYEYIHDRALLTKDRALAARLAMTYMMCIAVCVAACVTMRVAVEMCVASRRCDAS